VPAAPPDGLAPALPPVEVEAPPAPPEPPDPPPDPPPALVVEPVEPPPALLDVVLVIDAPDDPPVDVPTLPPCPPSGVTGGDVKSREPPPHAATTIVKPENPTSQVRNFIDLCIYPCAPESAFPFNWTNDQSRILRDHVGGCRS
jgi:hypothetical protein